MGSIQPEVQGIGTRLQKQPAAFARDRTKWVDWGFTFIANASAVSTRMVVLMEHCQDEIQGDRYLRLGRQQKTRL